MELTGHGLKRIYGRTKLFPKDVLSIISSGAAVDLGLAKGCQYFLFYSPPNKRTKVALVSEDRRRLVSIWETNYFLPAGLQKITRDMEEQARVLLRTFLFARAKEKELPKDPVQLRTTIRVYVGGRFEYERDGAKILSTEVRTLESALDVLMPSLAPIAKIIEENKKKSDRRIRYCISVFSSDDTHPIWSRFVGHANIMKRMT